MNTHFSQAILDENRRGHTAVIPDIKCISPKEGDLLQGRDPVTVANQLAKWGAPVLSVVTEPQRFGGSPKLLRDIVKATNIPVLRKDFITSEDMLAETAELGAAAVLLICATINEKDMYRFYDKSIKLGLEPFVEVCTTAEMELAKKLGAQLIGINNRNIATFEMDSGDASRTAAIARHAPAGAVLVSESGILCAKDAQLAAYAGANAVLVGTALWQTDDMEGMYRSLRVKRSNCAVKICGLMREQDIDAVNAARPNYIGFVFAKHRLQVTPSHASALRKRLSPGIIPVGVFVDEPIENIAALVNSGTIDMVQLHGSETEEYIQALKRQTAAPVIKAVAMHRPGDAQKWQHTRADYILLDSGSGATGKTFDWDLIGDGFNNKREFFLAGGLNALNIRDAIQKAAPFAVDISTGAETNGVKDPDKIAELIQLVGKSDRLNLTQERNGLK